MNGYTPTPKNPERLAYDAERKAYWDAKSLAYAQAHDEEGDGLPWLNLSDVVQIAITPKIISFMPEAWQIEAEAQAAEDKDWHATRESDYP